MPLLNNLMVSNLLTLAHIHRQCNECRHDVAQDYCRTCDEWYWIHAPGCTMYANHDGHRLYLIPFVEVR
jgi:hypothetical protein